MPLRQSPLQILSFLSDRLGRSPSMTELMQALGGMAGNDGTQVADTTDGQPSIPLGLQIDDSPAIQRPMLPDAESPVGAPLTDDEVAVLLRLLVTRQRNVAGLALDTGVTQLPTPGTGPRGSFLGGGGFGRGFGGSGAGL